MPDVIASPSVRRLAIERGVHLDELARRLGRTTIAREDVLGTGSVETDSSAWNVDHAAYGPVVVEPLSRPARIAAAQLSAAQTHIPPVTHHDGADVSAIEDLRDTLRGEGRKITALAFHVAVLARCLREFPRFNASLSADGSNLILKQYVHIGIAVDSAAGLVVPVIRDADRRTVSAIGAAIADFSARARARRIRPEDMGGASMTISSLGGLGGGAFTPIVNPPEVAILGLGRTEIRPVWTGEDFRPVPTTSLDLTYDHRVLNGADAARFLSRYRELVAQPALLVVQP